MKERIDRLDMSGMEMIKLLGGGNPGALRVLLELFNMGPRIDPDDAMKNFGPILALDTYNIWESDIWTLYKDICGESLVRTVAMLRAVQLGFLHESKLKAAIVNSYDHGLDVPGLHAQVCEHLPAFMKSEHLE